MEDHSLTRLLNHHYSEGGELVLNADREYARQDHQSILNALRAGDFDGATK